jgi:ATP-dependent RNA helicase RhlE
MSFLNLGLSEEIVRAVTERGYTTPTPIQMQAIPAVLAGGDLLGGAQTGTGKTAGFTLPILHRLADKSVKGPSSGRPRVRALILTPTRELAAQVEESVRLYGKYTKLSSMAMFGGVSINPQITRLKSRVDILVATPGRLLDHMQQRTVDLSGVQILVLDEADRMLDMGFIRDIKRILAALPKQRQNLLFSATFSDEVKTLADGLLNQPQMIEVARRNASAEGVTHTAYAVAREKKRGLLAHLIKHNRWSQVLVFTRTKHGANKLAELLIKDGIEALAIHGNKSQSARTQALAKFKSGRVPVLVATDIAARGIDITELPHVVHFDLPNVPEDYVHRSGRTARAGALGDAVSLVCIDDRKLLTDIERLLKRQMPLQIIAGFEPDPSERAQPIQNGRGRGAPSPEQRRPSQGRRNTSAKPGARPAAQRHHSFGGKPNTHGAAARRSAPAGRSR